MGDRDPVEMYMGRTDRKVTTMKDDTISRAAALTALNGCTEIYLNNLPPTIYKEDAIKAVRALPPATDTNVATTQPGWIPVTERLPENEQEVFVTVEVRPYGRKPFRRVVRAFYTDGRHTDADSAYSWDEFPDPQYDDDDNMIIPEGWWESSDYLEQQGMIDDFVIAWREPLKPWEGDDK